jgi:hypothetical protein
MGDKQDDLATLAAVGALAAIAAALGHEAVGHAGSCLATGGEVTLLTAIWFRCSPGSALVDVAGPLGGVGAAAVGVALASWSPRSALRVRLFGLLLGSFAGFWFFAQLVVHVTLGRDDWSVAAGWSGNWRAAAVAGGVIGYGVMLRLTWRLAERIGRGPRDRRRFLVPHAAGALGLIACAALRPSDGSALEMTLTLAVAPLGFVWAVTRPLPPLDTAASVERSWPWTMAGMAALIAYAGVFGFGVGQLA